MCGGGGGELRSDNMTEIVDRLTGSVCVCGFKLGSDGITETLCVHHLKI